MFPCYRSTGINSEIYKGSFPKRAAFLISTRRTGPPLIIKGVIGAEPAPAPDMKHSSMVGSLRGDSMSVVGREIAAGLYYICVPENPVRFFREWPTWKLKKFYHIVGEAADELRWDASLAADMRQYLALLDSAESARKIVIYIATELAKRGVRVGRMNMS